MAILHKVLFVWSAYAMLFIMLPLRLDTKTHWSWFVVLSPMWVLDVKTMGYVLFKLFKHCRPHITMNGRTCRYIRRLSITILKSTFQMLVCLKLEVFPFIPWCCVFIPLWLVLLNILTVLFRSLRSNYPA